MREQDHQENLRRPEFSQTNSVSPNAQIQSKQEENNQLKIPQISLPKGGGAIKSIDEKFSVNAINGTAAFSLPLPVSDARGVAPALVLSHNTGAGNGMFGLGWNAGPPSIKRKTEMHLPEYRDAFESDIFIFS